jgi:hypothetical protein
MDIEPLVRRNKSYGLQKKVNGVKLGIRIDTIDVNVIIIPVRPII